MDYEYAKEKDIKELYDLQLRAFESEAEMINSRNVRSRMRRTAQTSSTGQS